MLKYEGKKDMAKHLNRDALLQEAGWEDIHFTWARALTGSCYAY